MDHPVIVKLHPERLDESVKSPVLTGLLEKGWTIGTTLILQDPRKQQGDDTRIGLLMVPPLSPPEPPEKFPQPLAVRSPALAGVAIGLASAIALIAVAAAVFTIVS